MAEFKAARLKIQRGATHAEELEKVLRVHLAKLLPAARSEPGLGDMMAIPLPDLAACILGDALHNLRSALDLMMWEAVERSGGTPDKNTEFVIAMDRTALLPKLRKAAPALAGPTINYLADHARPYQAAGGDDVLVALHQLDIVDKHRLVIPVLFADSYDPVVDFIDDSNERMRFTGNAVASVTAMGTLFKVLSDERAADYVCFGDGNPWARRPVLSSLEVFRNRVAEVVGMVEARYP